MQFLVFWSFICKISLPNQSDKDKTMSDGASNVWSLSSMFHSHATVHFLIMHNVILVATKNNHHYVIRSIFGLLLLKLKSHCKSSDHIEIIRYIFGGQIHNTILYMGTKLIAGVTSMRLKNWSDLIRHAGNMLVNVYDVELVLCSNNSCFEAVNSWWRMWKCMYDLF